MTAPATAGLIERTKRRRMNSEQRKWADDYKHWTMFEPLMDEFYSGGMSFYECARKSIRWFEDWSSDAYLRVSNPIPGEDEAFDAALTKEPPCEK